MNTVRILSIDGGGIRGIIPLTVLKYLEDKTGQQIHELFDVIGGTSTGGIIALGLNSQSPDTKQIYRAKDLLSFYTEDGNHIFDKNKYFLQPENKEDNDIEETIKADERLRNPGFWHPTYSSQGIETYLKDKFCSDTKMSQLELKPDVTVFSYDIQNDCPYYFNSKKAREQAGHDYYIWQAARATSAAPTFFPAAKFSSEPNSPVFVDGGVYINNPALALLIQAKDLYPNEQNFLLISLGTGGLKVSRAYLENLGAITWLTGWGEFKKYPAGALLEVMMKGASDTIHRQLQQLVSDNSNSGFKIPSLKLYERYQKELSENIAMDDIKTETIQKLENIGEALVKENEDSLKKLCDVPVGN